MWPTQTRGKFFATHKKLNGSNEVFQRQYTKSHGAVERYVTHYFRVTFSDHNCTKVMGFPFETLLAIRPNQKLIKD